MKNTTTTRENGQATKAKPGAAKGLHDLFVNELKDIYWAEKALTKAIPVMIKNATADELVEALTGHLEVTKEHITRLEDTEEGMVRDAGIIAASQKAEHYEIASYGTLCSFAKTLGESEAAALLLETLDEEKEADVKLSEIAESFINMEAVVEVTDEESAGRSAPKAKTARK
jgi:ferritin-like metal-binding protein YciE